MSVSREYYDETKNWLEAQWQEGVPVMDADLNAAQRIRQMWIRRMITELLGNGSPNNGFNLSGSVADPMIHAGDIYVTGLRIVQNADIAASTQPNAPVTFPSGDGIWYLDIQLVLITNVEDPDLRDSRLPGTVETPIKMWKIDWTLRKESGTSLPVPPSTHIFIGIAQETGGVFTDIRNDGMLAAGADTGFQDTEGDRPGSGHTHHDEDIVVDSPDYSGENLEEVLGEIDSRIEVVESGVGTVTPDVNGNETVAEHFADETIHRRNHNDMESIQGGVTDERFHIELDLYEAATGASGANAGNPFATVGDLTGVAAKFSIPVQTVQELRDVSETDRSDKQVRLVEDKGSLYRFDETGTGTDDGDGIITPTSGTGRWFRISSAVPDLSTVLAKGNSAGGQRITSLQNPSSASDAATKDYVDTNSGDTFPGYGTGTSDIGSSSDPGSASSVSRSDHVHSIGVFVPKYCAKYIVDQSGDGHYTSLAAALSALGSNNGEIFVKEGSYAVGAEINGTSLGSVAIIGEGMGITRFVGQSGFVGGDILDLNTATGEHIHLEGFTVDSGAAGWSKGISLHGNRSSIAKRIEITAGNLSVGSNAVLVSDCIFNGARGGGDAIDASGDKVLIRGNKFAFSQYDHHQVTEIFISSTYHLNIEGNVFLVPDTINASMEYVTCIHIFSNTRRAIVSHNHMRNKAGLYASAGCNGVFAESILGGPNYALVNDNMFEDFDGVDPAYNGGLIVGMGSVVSRDNVYINCTNDEVIATGSLDTLGKVNF